MDFTLPEQLPGLVAEMDAFVEREIAPLQAEHMQYFGQRREHARTAAPIGTTTASRPESGRICSPKCADEPTKCRWPTTARTGWCATPPTVPCRSSATWVTAVTSRSSTSTVTIAGIQSPRAPRKSRSAGWRSGCSISVGSDATRQLARGAGPDIGDQRDRRESARADRWCQPNHLGIRRRDRRGTPLADPAHRSARRRARRNGAGSSRPGPPARRSPVFWLPTIRLWHWVIRF